MKIQLDYISAKYYFKYGINPFEYTKKDLLVWVDMNYILQWYHNVKFIFRGNKVWLDIKEK